QTDKSLRPTIAPATNRRHDAVARRARPAPDFSRAQLPMPASDSSTPRPDRAGSTRKSPQKSSDRLPTASILEPAQATVRRCQRKYPGHAWQHEPLLAGPHDARHRETAPEHPTSRRVPGCKSPLTDERVTPTNRRTPVPAPPALIPAP